MSNEYKRLRIKGHRLVRVYQTGERGVGGVDGRCECGNWNFPGWTQFALRVVESHNNHLYDVAEARAAAKTKGQ